VDVALLSDSLEELYFSFVDFSGSIPTELGMLSELRALILYWNELDGPIPTELGRLTNLEYLELTNNMLSGTIPTELGVLSNLSKSPSAILHSLELMNVCRVRKRKRGGSAQSVLRVRKNIEAGTNH